MTKNLTSTWNDRELALAYIKERGYASHSSFRRYIKGEAPSPFVSSHAQIFGKELHSRFLEAKKLEKLGAADELLMKKMIGALDKNRLVKGLLNGANVEEEFREKIFGIDFLGYMDIHVPKKHVADVKTTKHTTPSSLANSLDFLQPAIYLQAKKLKDFYYIGITKTTDPKVIVLSVRDYPDKLKAAQQELKRWCLILKKDLK
jgi:hypothetical protein